MHYGEWIVVALIVVGAAGWLIRHYTDPKRRQKMGQCNGKCSECSMLGGDCLDPELRDRLRRGSFPPAETDIDKQN